MPLALSEIQAQFHQLRANAMRHRDIANHLNISEAELIAAHVGEGSQSIRLQAIKLNAQWPEIMAAVSRLGTVMALTRNEACVHEKIGQYQKISCQGKVGLVLGGPIDLRIFYNHWSSGFAVIEQNSVEQKQYSLQFFDETGAAIHKIFLKEPKEVEFRHLADEFAATEQSPQLTLVHPNTLIVAEKNDNEIKVDDFRNAWSALEDTHDFFMLLKKYQVSRLQALRLAPPPFAYQVENQSIEKVLNLAVLRELPIMVFVGNLGMTQIHTGQVFKIFKMGEWLNVMDADFNLHLRTDLISQSWVVKKPTKDGIVTSLELFNAQGECIAMLFGERKPGIPELDAWRTVIASLTIMGQVSCAS